MAFPRPALPDPERTRRIVGAVIYVADHAGRGAGPSSSSSWRRSSRAIRGASTSRWASAPSARIPPLAIYLWIPRLIDRFDPEPWWALALVLGWGAIAACGVAATVNTGVEVARQRARRQGLRRRSRARASRRPSSRRA